MKTDIVFLYAEKDRSKISNIESRIKTANLMFNLRLRTAYTNINGEYNDTLLAPLLDVSKTIVLLFLTDDCFEDKILEESTSLAVNLQIQEKLCLIPVYWDEGVHNKSSYFQGLSSINLSQTDWLSKLLWAAE